MFENPMNPLQNARILDEHCCENLYAYHYNMALKQFRAELLKGKFFRLQQKALHRNPLLYDWSTVKSGLHMHGSRYSGMKVVRIDSIIGSEGKTADFDLRFHPLSESGRERWVNMAIAYLSRTPLPPVQLLEIGGVYFIRDGHHRVSVGRAFQQVAIDAEVISWNAAPPFPRQSGLVPEYLYSLGSMDLPV
jgi:hypothetical protein